MKPIFTLFLVFQLSTGFSQILFYESFNVILDSTKTVQGSIVPDLKFLTQVKNVLQFENLADITIKNKTHVFTLANKVDFSKLGKETFLSGGYFYAEYRKILEKKFSMEFFSQIHWEEARGLQRKYAGGVTARIRIKKQQNLGLFIGGGPFYEYEKWTYQGVLPEFIPPEAVPITTQKLKMGSYISFKYAPLSTLFLDFSVYHQGLFKSLFSTTRIASSTKISYRFTQHIGFAFLYQNIYDPAPVVPIDHWFHKITFGISVNF